MKTGLKPADGRIDPSLGVGEMLAGKARRFRMLDGLAKKRAKGERGLANKLTAETQEVIVAF